jgi:DNA-binding MurR/RpiR family transcriptional regulator
VTGLREGATRNAGCKTLQRIERMPRMTITAIAAAVGVHKSTVSRQSRTWRLVGDDGLVDLDDYQRLRSAAVDPALQTSGPGAALAPPPGEPRAMPALAAGRTRKVSADAELAELELARRKEQLLDRDQAERAAEDLARRLRDRILMVPRTIARELVLLPDEGAVAGHLTLALERALSEEHDALRGAA